MTVTSQMPDYLPRKPNFSDASLPEQMDYLCKKPRKLAMRFSAVTRHKDLGRNSRAVSNAGLNAQKDVRTPGV
jgi:hypothetical protein